MNLAAIQRGLWVAVLVAQVILVGALVRRGLARRYPFFLLYLASDALWGLTLIQIDFHSTAYAYGYRIYMIMDCVLQFAVGAELYEKVCEHFRNIGRFRFYLAAFLTVLAALLSLAIFRPELAAEWKFPQTIAIWLERFETTMICGVLLLTRLFLHDFMNARPPVRPNVLSHWLLLSCYFGVIGGSSAAFLLVHGAPAAIYSINIVMLTGELACLMFWMKSFVARGELAPEIVEWSLEGQARKEEMLDALVDLVDEARHKILDRH